jgi:hypothetical protein
VDAQKVAECFRDHWLSKAGKDARKVDWSATWRNWCREDKSRKRNLLPPNVLHFGPRPASGPIANDPEPARGTNLHIAWQSRQRRAAAAARAQEKQDHQNHPNVIDGEAEQVEAQA